MTFKIVEDIAGINQALFCVTHGLYILVAGDATKLNGQCLDALMQITSKPPRIAIGVGKRTYTNELIRATGRFLVNVLNGEDAHCYDKVKHFGMQTGRNVDKFANVKYELSKTGLPILPEAKAYYECMVVPAMTLDLDTHNLFIGEILNAGSKEEGEPLTYNEYRKVVKKGR